MRQQCLRGLRRPEGVATRVLPSSRYRDSALSFIVPRVRDERDVKHAVLKSRLQVTSKNRNVSIVFILFV